MNGFFLLIPFLLIRFVLLFGLDRNAVRRAAHFAPLRGREKIAYLVYQTATAGILLHPFFLTARTDFSPMFFAGATCYVLGLCLLAASVVAFSSPDDMGLNTNGIYRLSRNPMYVAYFVCFIGIAMLTKSLVLLGMVLTFQISAHWIILAEERWCLENFGDDYRRYMAQARRYI